MFGWLDVAILLLIILCVVVGMWRGFIGSLAKLLGGFLRLVLSILLTKPVVKLISLTNLNEHMFDKLTLKYSGISEKFNVNLVGMQEKELNTFIGDALADAKIPKLFRGLFQNLFGISPEVIASKESVTIAELMGVAVGNIILLVAVFVFLIVLFWLLSKIIMRWSKKRTRGNTAFAKTNKWLGGLFGFIKSLIIIFIAFITLSFLSTFAFMNNVVNYVNSSFLGSFLYKLSNSLLASSFNIKALIESWIVN